MVYLKINAEIWALINEVGLKKLVGCSVLCGMQIISYEDLSLLVDVQNGRIEKAKDGWELLKLRNIIDRT